MWQRLKAWAKEIENEGLTLWFACRHPEMPLLPKILALLVVAYFMSPIDLIPDFIPVLGYLDEVILLPVSIYLILKLVPAPVIAECRPQAEAWTAAHKPTPRSVAGALIIMVLWMVFFGLVWKYFGAAILRAVGAA